MSGKAIITAGRTGVILKGKDAGKKASIVKVSEGKIVEVITEEGKKRKLNFMHLWPLEAIIKTKEKKELVKELRNMKIGAKK